MKLVQGVVLLALVAAVSCFLGPDHHVNRFDNRKTQMWPDHHVKHFDNRKTQMWPDHHVNRFDNRKTQMWPDHHVNRFDNLKTQITNCASKFVCDVTSTENFHNQASWVSLPWSWSTNLCTVQCVDKLRICDGTADCDNSADELNCPDAAPTYTECRLEQYRCQDNATCLNPDELCDGIPKCPSGDDETGCPCAPPRGNFRLCDGDGEDLPNVSKGTLEVQINGVWGVICDFNWEEFDYSKYNLKVACEMFGYSGGRVRLSNYFNYTTTGEYLIDEVICDGTETNLLQCLYTAHLGDCRPSDILGIECYNP